MTQPNYGIARYQAAIKTSLLPPQDQQNPVYNNNPNSAADNKYPYNPPQQRAQEPVVTSSAGTTSSKIEPHEPSAGSSSGVLRLQLKAHLANRSLQRDVQQPQTISNADNRANLGIPEQLDYEPANYKKMIEYTQKQANKDFDRIALYSAISGLGGAISGVNTRYQEYWTGGLVK